MLALHHWKTAANLHETLEVEYGPRTCAIAGRSVIEALPKVPLCHAATVLVVTATHVAGAEVVVEDLIVLSAGVVASWTRDKGAVWALHGSLCFLLDL